MSALCSHKCACLETWGPPPICLETAASMSFLYGADKFQYCSWAVDAALYNRLKDVTQGHGAHARIASST